MKPNDTIQISTLTDYSPQDATQIGELMPQLDATFSDSPVDEALLQSIIDSPYHDQIVARDKSGQIIGTATLSITIGVGSGRTGYLNDFVVSDQLRGQGVGQKVWDSIMGWCSNQNIDLSFTSRPERASAHHFYIKNGAEIRPTAAFHKKVSR